MANSEEISIEQMTRKHRLLAAYMAMYAWTKQLDGIILRRADLLSFLGTKERASSQKIAWARALMKPYFPIVYGLFTNGKLKGMLISNRQLPAQIDDRNGFDYLFSRELDSNLVSLAGHLTDGHDFPTAIVWMPSELDMFKELSMLASGLAVPSASPKVHSEENFFKKSAYKTKT